MSRVTVLYNRLEWSVMREYPDGTLTLRRRSTRIGRLMGTRIYILIPCYRTVTVKRRDVTFGADVIPISNSKRKETVMNLLKWLWCLFFGEKPEVVTIRIGGVNHTAQVILNEGDRLYVKYHLNDIVANPPNYKWVRKSDLAPPSQQALD